MEISPLASVRVRRLSPNSAAEKRDAENSLAIRGNILEANGEEKPWENADPCRWEGVDTSPLPSVRIAAALHEAAGRRGVTTINGPQP